MKKCFVFFALVLGFVVSTESHAQVVRPADVTISMGLVPVYELSTVAGCPYLLAAPSPQWYNLSYKRCSTDLAIPITLATDKMNINEFMRNICDQNLREMNGCTAELIVGFPDMTPVFVGQDDEE